MKLHSPADEPHLLPLLFFLFTLYFLRVFGLNSKVHNRDTHRPPRDFGWAVLAAVSPMCNPWSSSGTFPLDILER